MNNKIIVLTAALLVLVLPLVTAAAITAVTIPAKADGVGNAKNFGQCKKDFPNGNGCASTKDFTKSSTPELTFVAQTCVNNGGNSPQGNCNGEGLSVQNPAGHEPPGQQP